MSGRGRHFSLLAAALLTGACAAVIAPPQSPSPLPPLPAGTPMAPSVTADASPAGPSTDGATNPPAADSSVTPGPPATEPPATDAPTATDAPATAPATATPQSGTLEWRAQGDGGLGPLFDLGFGPAFRSAAVFNDYFLLIGQATEGDEEMAAVWRSSDGLSWQRRALPVVEDSFADVRDLAANETAAVAVGSLGMDLEGAAAIWYSTDGRSWEMAAGPAGGGHFDVVGATDDGFVAFGGAAWISTDGVTWSEAGSSAQELAGRTVRALVPSGGRMFAFVGAEDREVEVWQSDDLQDWQRIGRLPGSTASIGQPVIGRGGWLVTGTSWRNGGRVDAHAAWTSDDGREWRMRSAPGPVSDALATDAGFVAVGYVNTGGGCAISEDEIQGFTWHSADGREWVELPREGWDRQRIDQLLRTGRTVIGVGISYRDERLWGHGAVWTARLPGRLDIGPSETPTPTDEPDGCGED